MSVSIDLGLYMKISTKFQVAMWLQGCKSNQTFFFLRKIVPLESYCCHKVGINIYHGELWLVIAMIIMSWSLLIIQNVSYQE